MIQHISFGRVNKHVVFIGQLQEVPWGRAHPPRSPFVIYYLPPFIRFSKPNSDDGIDQSSKMRAPQWVWDQVEHLRGL
jgi:hypothetical protein